MSAQFGVSFQFDVAGLIYIGVFRIIATITTRTDGSDGETANGIGTSHIELFGIRCCSAVAIGEDGSTKKACGQCETVVDGKGIGHLRRCLYKLCERTSEDAFGLLAYLLRHKSLKRGFRLLLRGAES